MTGFSAKARALRSSQTRAEVQLWHALRDRRLAGWKFRRQFPIDRFIADFACLDAKLVIEVDGATHSRDEEFARDHLRMQAIEACGFHILRVTNNEVYKNLDGVLETILAALEHRTTL